MLHTSAAVEVGMLSATLSAAAGVLILVGPYVGLLTAGLLALLATLPLVAVWRSLAAEEAALRAPRVRRPARAEPSRAV